MPHAIVQPVLDLRVRGLCRLPYEGAPRGCPNFGVKDRCPPRAPRIEDVFDLAQPVLAIWNIYDLAAHVERQRSRWPVWSPRQLANPRHWQAGARKVLREEIARVVPAGLLVLDTPEACGVNVTATMAAIGVHLEWPPVTVAYQVALAGQPRFTLAVRVGSEGA